MSKIREVTWALARSVELQEEAAAAYKAADAEFVAAYEERENAFRAAREETNELSGAIGSGQKVTLRALDDAGRAATKATARFDAAKRGLEASRHEYWAAVRACDVAFCAFAGDETREPEQAEAEAEPKFSRGDVIAGRYRVETVIGPKHEQAEPKHEQEQAEPKHEQEQAEPTEPTEPKPKHEQEQAEPKHEWADEATLSKHLPQLAAERARRHDDATLSQHLPLVRR